MPRTLLILALAMGWGLMSGVDAPSSAAPPQVDPAAFCRSVQIADEPPGGYDFPEWMKAAVPDGDVAPNTYWRCMGGEVYACAGFNSSDCIKPDQSRAPHPAMIEYCRGDPNASFIPRAGGGIGLSIHEWRCRNGRPQISRAGSAADLDQRGFVQGEWQRVSPPVQPVGASIPIFRQGASYRSVRDQLRLAGWQPTRIEGAQRCQDDRCRGFDEVLFCAGTGRAACSYAWRQGETFLVVWAVGEGEQVYDAYRLCSRIHAARPAADLCVPYDASRVQGPPSPNPASYLLPVTPTGRVHGFFDPDYRRSESRQHLGVDLPRDDGEPVVSPVSGTVVFNATGADRGADNAFLIIRERGSSTEHVLGHIRSSIQPGTPAAIVERGQEVGVVADWDDNSHVHWGVNTQGVPRSVQSGPGGAWGWGRAPATVIQLQATQRGWIDPNSPVRGEANLETLSVTVEAQEPQLTPDGYGDIRIGMTVAEVANTVGGRLSVKDQAYDPNDCQRRTTPIHPGMELWFSNGRLTHVDISEGSPVRTPRGIGVGATAAEVRRLYPGIQSEEAMHDNPPAENLIWWVVPERKGVIFRINELGRVWAIAAGSGGLGGSRSCH